MQTKKTSDKAEQRDTELENILGNLLIAEYQVEKLKGRLVEKITPPYTGATSSDQSSHSFKVGNKWYRVTLKVEEEPELRVKVSEV